jgi:peptidoglycan-N-acetylglucosamine deacetylase
MTNIITIDFEDIYYSNLLPKGDYFSREEERLGRSLHLLLELLDKYSYKATFFIVGQIAERYPYLIQQIITNGHSIGSHSHRHKMVYEMTRDEFAEDLQLSINALENAGSKKIVSYRAPSWSFKPGKTDWCWDVLAQKGIKYDSSIFPTKNFLYGDPNAPRFTHERPNGIIEVPPSTIRYIGKNVPFSGGFYLRLFPYSFLKNAIHNINKKGYPVVIYLHPWEIDYLLKDKVKLSFLPRIITYHNLKTNIIKFERLLKEFKFSSIHNYFNEKQDV